MAAWKLFRRPSEIKGRQLIVDGTDMENQNAPLGNNGKTCMLCGGRIVPYPQIKCCRFYRPLVRLRTPEAQVAGVQRKADGARLAWS